jgi:hypothetical protein
MTVDVIMGAQQTTRRPLTGRYSTVFLVLTVHCTYLLRPGCERLRAKADNRQGLHFKKI